MTRCRLGALELEPAITLPWLIRLRWLFVAGQLIVLPISKQVFGLHLNWWLFALVLVLGAVSNLVLARTSRVARWSVERLMGTVLILDVALLTVQLGALGGASNPFTVFYLVYITLSAVVLSARWTLAVAGSAIAGFALLFVVPTETHVHNTGAPLFNPHLQGMWVAFVLAAGAMAFFLRRITQSIASQREQIAALRETGARNARLASLATLAAGAAHELNSPLSTIAVAAHEANLRAGALGNAAIAADLTLILEEVDRCQGIIHQMAARATSTDDVEALSLEVLVARIREQLGEERSGRMDVVQSGEPRELRMPSVQLVQSITALVKNALDASPPSERVELEISNEPTQVSIAVEDHGSGIAPDVLSKVGEPFFTTKQPGHGLGLGVFLARVFVESRGGVLSIESVAGTGTRAVVRLPLAEATA